MFGNTGYIHAPKRTKKELETMLRLEARSHANTCEELAAAMRLINSGGRADAVAGALEKAAKFMRHFTEEKK